MTREEAILVLDSLSTWIGCEIPITEEIVEAIKTLSKSPISPNLEEAAKKTYPMTTTPPTPIEVAAYYNAAQQKLRNAFKAGAKCDREQMMKETVEGEVVSTSDNGWECIRIYKKLHKCDDKVKLIIVKED